MLVNMMEPEPEKRLDPHWRRGHFFYFSKAYYRQAEFLCAAGKYLEDHVWERCGNKLGEQLDELDKRTALVSVGGCM